MSNATPSVLSRTLLGEVFKNPKTLLAMEAALQAALVDNPSSIGVALTAPNFVAEFGGVGDGTTNNDAAFTAAEASAYADIYLPAGNFLTALSQSALQKHYEGPGKIVITGVATMPGRFSYLATPPSVPPAQGATGFFAGDTSSVDPEWHVIGPGTRQYLTHSRYFEPSFIPHPVWLDVYSGGSGWLTTAAGAASPGDGSMTLVAGGTTGMTVGKTYGVTNAGMDGTITDTITIDTIVGDVITFHPNLTASYPNINPPPANAAPGRAVILDTHRTWAGVYYAKVTAEAGGFGDVYGAIWRMIQAAQPLAGQLHFFETGTVGQAGGSIDFNPGSSGTFGTGWESQYNDNGEDVAVMGQIDSFNRTNDTGARSAVWLGLNFQSGGTKPVDAALVLSGKYRVGLDTVKADLTTFLTASDGLNAAISTAIGHRWIMNSTASLAGRGGSAEWGTFYGNTPGDMYVESGNDGTSDFIAMRFNRAAGSDGRIRLRPNSFQVNVPIQGASTIEAANALVCGAANPQVVFGSGLGVWIIWDGTHLKATINNGVSYTNIV